MTFQLLAFIGEKPSMFGRDRDKIRIPGDIIEPIDVMWEAETGKMWEREDDSIQ